MERNFDLIRNILRIVEAAPANTVLQANDFKIEGGDLDTVIGHIDLLIKAGLLDGKVIKTMRGLSGVLITGLTWTGHEFLSAARDDTVWAKAKDKFFKGAASFTFDLVKKWLESQLV